MAFSEREVQSFESKWVLALWGLNWDEDNPGAGVKVGGVGAVSVLLVLLFTALRSRFLCSSVTS